MTDDAKKPEDEIAALRAEVEALKAAQPKPQQSAEEIERSMARARDELHQMREGRMAYAMHPSVVRDMAGGVTNADIQDIVRASHRPQGPNSAGAIPSSQQVRAAMFLVEARGGSSLGRSQTRLAPIGLMRSPSPTMFVSAPSSLERRNDRQILSGAD